MLGEESTMNWPWLVVALPAGGAGLLLGVVLSRKWDDDNEVTCLVGGACIVVAIAAWGAAFFNIVPLAGNATAVAALAIRVGLYQSRKRSSSGAVAT